jgi:hypothetical protein
VIRPVQALIVASLVCVLAVHAVFPAAAQQSGATTSDADGSLDVDVRLPHPGAYPLIADFVPEGSEPQLVQRWIERGRNPSGRRRAAKLLHCQLSQL